MLGQPAKRPLRIAIRAVLILLAFAWLGWLSQSTSPWISQTATGALLILLFTCLTLACNSLIRRGQNSERRFYGPSGPGSDVPMGPM